MLDKGIMPFNAGWMEQANKYIEIMDFISMQLNKHIKDQRKDNGRQ